MLATFMFSSCTSLKNDRSNPQPIVKFEKSDFTISGQVSAEATVTEILTIDFAHLFKSEQGSFGNAGLPIIGGFVTNKAEALAIYKLLEENPGYDVVLYPQFQTKCVRPLGIGLLTQTTTVKVTARLGKLK